MLQTPKCQWSPCEKPTLPLPPYPNRITCLFPTREVSEKKWRIVSFTTAHNEPISPCDITGYHTGRNNKVLLLHLPTNKVSVSPMGSQNCKQWQTVMKTSQNGVSMEGKLGNWTSNPNGSNKVVYLLLTTVVKEEVQQS